MTQEHATPQTAAMRPRDAFAPDPSELTDAELALVVGGGGDGAEGAQPIGSTR
jgi:hypothetical protein